MARIQNPTRFTIPQLLLVVLRTLLVSSCHPGSQELHICLNIYLERDFPLIETIVQGQHGRRGRGRVILEGPDLSNICRDITTLRHCYSKLFPECVTMWQFDRFTRLMNVLNATHHHLCGDGTNNVRDLLLNTECMYQAKTNIAQCTGFDWWMSWRQVLRMQVSAADSCLKLKSYRKCLRHQLSNVSCGEEAAKSYIGIIDVWLNSWCGENVGPIENKKYFYYAMNANKYIKEKFDDKRLKNSM